MSGRLTFAVPYYRGLDYLREAIDSVRAQTIDDWELVVVDDRGPEPAAELVASYEDPRMRSVRNETNLGLAGNWNECLRQSRTRLVTLLHQDDRLLPRYAERVAAAAAEHPGAAAYFTDVRVIGADGSPTTTPADLAKRVARRPRHDYDLVGDQGLAALLSTNFLYCPSLCLDRDVVGEDPFDASFSMVLDLEFTTRQLLAGRRLRSLREPLFEYRRHEHNQTEVHTADATRFREELDFYRGMARVARDRGWSRSQAASRRRVMVRGHLVQRLLADVAGRRFEAARGKARMLGEDLRGTR